MFEISRRETRCILKMKNVKQDLHGAEFACEVNGDKTVCRINVEGKYHRCHKLLASSTPIEVMTQLCPKTCET